MNKRVSFVTLKAESLATAHCKNRISFSVKDLEKETEYSSPVEIAPKPRKSTSVDLSGSQVKDLQALVASINTVPSCFDETPSNQFPLLHHWPFNRARDSLFL